MIVVNVRSTKCSIEGELVQRHVSKIFLAVVVGAALTTTSCSSSEDALTLYSSQHGELIEPMIEGFTKKTGIEVDVRSGGDSELANQIIQEGDSSPADVFVTENSPAMTLVDSKNLFAKLDAPTLSQVPAGFTPSDGQWTGFAARSTVWVYNSKRAGGPSIPGSILDLAKPEWKGRFGVAAAGADFQAIVSAVLALTGEQATTQWLEGLKANAKIYRNNIAVMTAANAGEIEGGVMYHYYWYKDRAESGANSANTELHFFGKKDPGAFLSVSGAGVLVGSDQPTEAQQLVAYLTSAEGQRILTDSGALEYTIGSGIPINSKLKPIAELDAPSVDLAALNGQKVQELMQKVGLL